MSDTRNTPSGFGTPRPGATGAPAPAAEASDSGSGSEPADHRRLAHELNNLLDGSLRNLSLALAELRDPNAADPAAEPLPEETARRLQTANESMQQMADLLRRWMTAESGAAGEPESGASAGPETLGEAVERARRQIEPLLAARGIALEVELAPELAGEPAVALQQVIRNALRNAVEAIDRDGRIELSCTREGDELVLRVRDDGPGPVASLPRGADGLPEPGITTKPGGHGMGLTISRRIAESMGGSLRLDAAVGGGAVLTLRCPAASAKRDRGDAE